jgi:hypothetical protein
MSSILWNPNCHCSVYKSLHWFLSLVRSTQSSTLNSISLRSVLLLSTQLHLGLPRSLFLMVLQPIAYKHSSFPHSCFPVNLFPINLNICLYLAQSTSYDDTQNVAASNLIVTSFLLLCTLFSNTLSIFLP